MNELDDPLAELLNSLKFDKRTHDDELVVTKAGEEIHRTHRALYNRGDELQCFVSRQMSKAVVDVLEIVDIDHDLSLIHISEPTRLGMISYAVFCLKKKKKKKKKNIMKKYRK